MSTDSVFAGKIRGDVSIDNNLTKMESNVEKYKLRLYRHSSKKYDRHLNLRLSHEVWRTVEKGAFISGIQGNKGQLLREKGKQRQYCMFVPLFPPREQGNSYSV